ncbi:MAG: hypothetical protein HC775_12465 [Hyellaceae cyanobacterium CSU_1_1]|nr:hypothetical protein [Hyellaceae cyanobacterium CSU_1_1]
MWQWVAQLLLSVYLSLQNAFISKGDRHSKTEQENSDQDFFPETRLGYT